MLLLLPPVGHLDSDTYTYVTNISACYTPMPFITLQIQIQKQSHKCQATNVKIHYFRFANVLGLFYFITKDGQRIIIFSDNQNYVPIKIKVLISKYFQVIVIPINLNFLLRNVQKKIQIYYSHCNNVI